MRGLFRGQNLHPAVREDISRVGSMDMPVQRNGVVLSQDGDAFNPGVETVTHGNVDQAVFAGERHGRFGPVSGKRI
jgi:hypothetical protein